MQEISNKNKGLKKTLLYLTPEQKINNQSMWLNDILTKTLKVFLLLIFLFCFSNCKESEKQKDEKNLIDIDIDTSSVVFRYKNTIFNLPSPQQTNMFIKEYGIKYNDNLLNPVNNYSKYTSNIKKGLNIGVYSTDIGYINVYGQTQNTLQYFLVIEKLAQDLKVSTAIPDASLEDIERNLGNNDSILYIVSNTFQRIDEYLKNNNREVIGVLIIAGSWIESMYIMTQTISYSIDKRSELIKLITKQKYPLEKLIKMLAPYYDQNEIFTKFIDQLTDIAYEFDCIDVLYNYKEPETYPKEKMTIIQSEATYNMNDYNFSVFTEKFEKLRNFVIN